MPTESIITAPNGRLYEVHTVDGTVVEWRQYRLSPGHWHMVLLDRMQRFYDAASPYVTRKGA